MVPKCPKYTDIIPEQAQRAQFHLNKVGIKLHWLYFSGGFFWFSALTKKHYLSFSGDFLAQGLHKLSDVIENTFDK